MSLSQVVVVIYGFFINEYSQVKLEGGAVFTALEVCNVSQINWF